MSYGSSSCPVPQCKASPVLLSVEWMSLWQLSAPGRRDTCNFVNIPLARTSCRCPFQDKYLVVYLMVSVSFI